MRPLGGGPVLMFGHSVPPGMLDQAVTAGPNALVLVQNLGQINVYSLGNCVDTPPATLRHPPDVLTVGGSLQSLKLTEHCTGGTKPNCPNTASAGLDGGLQRYTHILETGGPELSCRCLFNLNI